MNHVSYCYKSLRDLLSIYARLRDQGILPFRRINYGPAVSMYYHDPDGARTERAGGTMVDRNDVRAPSEA